MHDNSTRVDSLNIFRCLYVAGFPANTTIATDNAKTLVVFNPISSVNTRRNLAIAKDCFKIFAHGMAFSQFNYDVMPGYLTPVGDLGHMPYQTTTPVELNQNHRFTIEQRGEIYRNHGLTRKELDQENRVQRCDKYAAYYGMFAA